MSQQIQTKITPDLENDVRTLYELAITVGINSNPKVLIDSKSITFDNMIKGFSKGMRTTMTLNRISRTASKSNKDIFYLSGLLTAIRTKIK